MTYRRSHQTLRTLPPTFWDGMTDEEGVITADNLDGMTCTDTGEPAATLRGMVLGQMADLPDLHSEQDRATTLGALRRAEPVELWQVATDLWLDHENLAEAGWTPPVPGQPWPCPPHVEGGAEVDVAWLLLERSDLGTEGDVTAGQTVCALSEADEAELRSSVVIYDMADTPIGRALLAWLGGPDLRALRREMLADWVHQRLDNTHDMGVEITLAEAVGYWVVRLTHDRDVHVELAERWDEDWHAAVDMPRHPNPWDGFLDAIHGLTEDMHDLLDMLRDMKDDEGTDR